MQFVQCHASSYTTPLMLVQYRVLSRQSPFLPVQGVGVALNVSTLEEALYCYKGVAVNDFSLWQVHLMTCGPYILHQSWCSHISILECPLVFTEAVLQDSARLSNISLGIHSRKGIWYTTPVHWSMGTGSLGWAGVWEASTSAIASFAVTIILIYPWVFPCHYSLMVVAVCYWNIGKTVSKVFTKTFEISLITLK